MVKLKCWNKTTDFEWYNPLIKSKINLIPMGNGYKVKITNLTTKSSSWRYKTGKTKKMAEEEAIKYMKENDNC